MWLRLGFSYSNIPWWKELWLRDTLNSKQTNRLTINWSLTEIYLQACCWWFRILRTVVCKSFRITYGYLGIFSSPPLVSRISPTINSKWLVLHVTLLLINLSFSKENYHHLDQSKYFYAFTHPDGCCKQNTNTQRNDPIIPSRFLRFFSRFRTWARDSWQILIDGFFLLGLKLLDKGRQHIAYMTF